jgi:hypothetical protein
MSADIDFPLFIESVNGIVFTLQSMPLRFKRDKYYLAVVTTDTLSGLLSN